MLQVANIHMFIENITHLFCSEGFSVINSSVVFAAVPNETLIWISKDDQHFLLSQKFACTHYTYM